MARKKQEIQLQRELETQEEWEECMAMEGLWVVDVYQEWCGPCVALTGNFRRLKNELGDPLLNFAIAKADTIDALEKYRGRCEPTFLFFAGGILTSFIHGANAPKVQRVITEQLAHEHKVLEGTAERKEVKDTVMTRAQEIEEERAREEAEAKELEAPDSVPASDRRTNATEEPKGFTVAIIKPDAIAQGKADEIKAEMQEAGIEILAEEERTLTEDEAREMYSHLQDEEFYDELIKFMSSGPSHLLVLTKGATGETVLKDWRDMLGPADADEAKNDMPESLRAKYGEKGYMNALHGSSTQDTAAKELAFFFPNLVLPTFQKKKENIQRTLALIRPQAFAAHKDEIMSKIQEAGFTIALHKEIQLTKEQAAEFYKEHQEFDYFEPLCETMSSGPLLALGLARDEAITAWRDMLGPANIDDAKEQAPNSLRAQFQLDPTINMFHGSDSEETAKKELNFFFPMEQTVGVIKPGAMGTKDDIIEKIHEAGFRIAAHKETTITPELAEILYPNCKDAEYYNDLVQNITSGPTMFMVLSREGAVDGWRQAIGETDPEVAKTNQPDSLRAKFGQDVLNNAVHGSSNLERAVAEMIAVFGEMKFNTDGTVQGEAPELDEAAVVIVQDPVEDASEIAPEYRRDDDNTVGDTTMDQTSMDPTADTTATAMDATTVQNETQDLSTVDETADTTQEPTADLTTVDETSAMDETTTAGDETTTAGDETTTAGDETTTQGDATTTQAEDTTTQGDATQAGDTTQAGETTVAETTTVTDDTTAQDSTLDETNAGNADGTIPEESTQDETQPAAEQQQQQQQESQPTEQPSEAQQQEEAPKEEPAPESEPAQAPATEEAAPKEEAKGEEESKVEDAKEGGGEGSEEAAKTGDVEATKTEEGGETKTAADEPPPPAAEG